MRMYTDVKFTHPIEHEGPFPSVGGFEVHLRDGSEIGFDFNETSYLIDDEDPRIVHVECRYEDLESFPEMARLKRHIHEIVELTDFHVDMEALYDEGKLTEFRSVLSVVLESEPIEGAQSNENVEIENRAEDICLYRFTQALLDTCEHSDTWRRKNRCRDCASLTEVDGEWHCDDAGRACNAVEDCPCGLL